MIKYVIKGRLGNQMFIYAYARANYERNKIPYCFNYLGNLTYFKLTLQDRFLNFIKKIYFKLFLENNSNTIFINADDCWTDHTGINFDPDKNYVLSGYFQGEMYFSNIADKLLTFFDIKPKYKSQYEKLIKENPDVAIHIRRGDYNNITGSERLGGPDLSLPISYYKEVLGKYGLNKKIIFLSDDINLVKNWFIGFIEAQFVSNPEIIDFQILLNSRTCIISNSTFSWWAAWLNKNNDKKIIVPRYFLGFKVEKEFPMKIIPAEWIQLEVKDEE